MKKEEKFIKTPVYPGGNKAMSEFIRKNLRYPKDALENKIEGTVVVVLDIDKKGNVIKAKARKGIGHGCDEEAIRVTKLLKFDVGKNRGVKLTFHKTLNIPFKLPIIKKVPIKLQYNTNSSNAGKPLTIKYIIKHQGPNNTESK